MKLFLLQISILVLCGFIHNTARAQNQLQIDSLMNVLKTAKEDTSKANTLDALSDQLTGNGDYEIATKYANDELTLSKKINYKKGEANAYTNIGLICAAQGNYPEALKNYSASLKIRKEIDDKRNIALNYSDIGRVYTNQSNYPMALKYFSACLKIMQSMANKLGIASAYSNIGVIYMYQGNLTDAMKNYFRSLKIYEEMAHIQGQASTYVNIGLIYYNQGNYSEALKNVFAGLKIYEEVDAKKEISFCYSNIGTIYQDQGNSSEAIKYLSASLKIQEETGDKYGIALSQYNLGNVYSAKGNNSEALRYFIASLKTSEEIGDKGGIAQANMRIGNMNVKLKNFPEGKKYLDEALILAKETGNIEAIKYCYGALADLDSNLGNYAQALVHYKLYVFYKDSLLNEGANQQILEMQTKYDTEKKEREIALLTKDKEVQRIEINKQKLLQRFSMGALAFLLILSFFVYNNFRIANKLKLQNIRNRIASDLHDDVGSTLNSISIYSEVAKQKSPTVVDELEQIGDASRKIIEVMSDIVWTINPKNDTFENIILRMSTLTYNLLKAKNIEHIFQADDSLNDIKLSLESRRNLYLIFKEALNNLVKYSNATRASITLTRENGFIKLSIRDNGVGFDVAQTSKGNGLLNMKARAEEMKAKLKIESEKGNGTNLELILKG